MRTKEKTVIKVAIGIPNEAYILPEAYDNHLLHALHLGILQEKGLHDDKKYRYEFYWYTSARLLTQLARERLMEVALQGGCDFLIMYDSDMLMHADMSEQMLEDMRKHKEIEVLGALAFMRNPPHYPVMYNLIDGWDEKTHSEIYIREFVKHYPRNILVECDAVGFGAVCIRLDMVRKKLTAPYFMSTTGTGEDLWFCYKAKKAGARIFMDTRIKLGHLKNPEIVTEEYFDDYIKRNKHDLGEVVPNKYLAKDH